MSSITLIKDIKYINHEHDDTKENIVFFMNDDYNFIYVDRDNNILQYYSNIDIKNLKIIDDYNNCKDSEEIYSRYFCLHFFQGKHHGIAHSISKLSTYLRFVDKYKSILVIPDNTHENIKKITDDIFSNIKYLEKNKKYIIRNFYLVIIFI